MVPCCWHGGLRPESLELPWELARNAKGQVSPQANWIRICISVKPSGDLHVHSNWRNTVVQHDITRYKWKHWKWSFCPQGLGGEQARSYQRSVAVGGGPEKPESQGVSQSMAPRTSLSDTWSPSTLSKYQLVQQTQIVWSWGLPLDSLKLYSSVEQGDDTE